MMTSYFNGLLIMLLLGSITWLISIWRKDVSIVDSIWSLMFIAAALVYYREAIYPGPRQFIILGLILIWGLRLSLYLTWRNWGEPEDRRYQAIRNKYQPHFAVKSLFIIFVFQSVLAWIVSMSLWPTLDSRHFSGWDIAGLVLWLTGMAFEVVGDWQLSRFKANPLNHNKVMDKGLWYYTRHPNYFGECLIWWGFYLMAISSGAWWSVISPLLMTWLLLKFSGVVMLEETINQRRPAYAEYIVRTNAFLPWRPKSTSTDSLDKRQHA